MVKMATLTKLAHKFNAIFIKIPAFFSEIDKLMLKCILKCIAKIILKKRSKVEELTMSQFQNLLESNNNQDDVVLV